MSGPMPPAVKWGRALVRSMREHGISNRKLAAIAYVDDVSISRYRTGASLPTIDTATRLSEALTDPALLKLLLLVRRKTCLACPREFVDGTVRMSRLYCTSRCESRTNARRRRPERAEWKAAANSKALTLYQETVDRFCRDCEPRGVCVTPSCHIQEAGLSPLPLSKEAAA